MAVAFKSSAIGGTNPTTSTTITIPGDTATGDILVVSLGSRGIVQTPGFGITDDDTGGNSWTRFANSASNTTEVWYKFATSGTASKTVTVTGANNSLSCVLKTFSGVDGPPVDAVPETNAGTDQAHVGQTPTNPDSMFCFAAGHYANDHDVTAMTSATAGSLTFTEHISTGGADCAVAFGHVGPTSANVGTVSWTTASGVTTTRNTRSIGFFLNPPPPITGQLGGTTPVGVTFLANNVTPDNLTTYTFAGVDFGAAADDRILVAVLWARDDAADFQIQSCTIGGVSATELVEVGEGVGVQITTAIYAAAVPTGTSGTVSFTMSEAIVGAAGYGLYRLVGADIVPVNTYSDNTNPLSLSIDIPAGGLAIGTSCIRDAANASFTVSWTGLTEDFEQFIAEDTRRNHSGASLVSEGGETGLTVTVTPSISCVDHLLGIAVFESTNFNPVILDAVTLSGTGTVADPGQGSLLFNSSLNAYLPLLVR